MFPDDATLIARGKLSTLNRERREQLQRVQGVCSTLITAAHQVLRDCEQKPPTTAWPIEQVEKCLENMKAARERIITLTLGINEIQPDAWPK